MNQSKLRPRQLGLFFFRHKVREGGLRDVGTLKLVEMWKVKWYDEEICDRELAPAAESMCVNIHNLDVRLNFFIKIPPP